MTLGRTSVSAKPENVKCRSWRSAIDGLRLVKQESDILPGVNAEALLGIFMAECTCEDRTIEGQVLVEFGFTSNARNAFNAEERQALTAPLMQARIAEKRARRSQDAHYPAVCQCCGITRLPLKYHNRRMAI